MSNATEEAFRKLCQQHDLTYEYSDDSRYWTRGQDSLAKLKKYAKDNLSREVAVRIWNEVVDTKLIESARAQFYWKD